MKKENVFTEEEDYWLTGGNTGTLPTRVTPSVIRKLSPKEIFVFGSNIKGMHSGGAARVAYNDFGAEWGNGEGLQGQSYAIPIMEGDDYTKSAIKRFTEFAIKHEEYMFLVTPVGCGIAGYSPEDIAPLFETSAHLKNVYLPIVFWRVLLANHTR